jgi:hypothetical protein
LIYGVAINPLAVATIQRLPHRTIDSIRPTPGTVSPRVAVQTPPGPSRTAVPSRTSRTVQPSIVVGLVSGTGTIVSRGATPAPDKFVFAWIAEEAVLDCKLVADVVLRTTPSIFLVDFISESRIRREHVTF